MTLYDATEQAYKNGYKQGYNDGKNSTDNWVSVKDKFPDIEQMCLLYTPCDGFIYVGFYAGNDNWQKRDKWKIITAMRSTQVLTKKVTHWMPLPETWRIKKNEY